jgi:hypothetical protein
MSLALSNALQGASGAAWDDKWNWDSVPVITAMCWLSGGRIIEAWLPLQGSLLHQERGLVCLQAAHRPHPTARGYVSGHVTFSLGGS